MACFTTQRLSYIPGLIVNSAVIKTQDIIKRLTRPSKTVTQASQIVSGNDPLAGWKKALTGQQIERILEIVNFWGLNFYSDALEPNYDRLYGTTPIRQTV